MCLSCPAEPEVRAELTGVRCLFPSPHDGSRHRLVLRVEVKPDAEGWFVSESPSRSLRIKGRDSAGNTLTSSLGGWDASPYAAGARTANFTFLLPSKIAYLDVNEELEMQLAEKLCSHPLHAVNMLEETRVQAGELSFLCKPDADNADEKNREKDGSLRRARLCIVCPAGVDVLRIGRVWKGGRDEETGADIPPYSQDLDIRHSTTHEGERCAYVVLWDAAVIEELEITTCMIRTSVRVPMRFRARLGDPAPETPADKAASS